MSKKTLGTVAVVALLAAGGYYLFTQKGGSEVTDLVSSVAGDQQGGLADQYLALIKTEYPFITNLTYDRKDSGSKTTLTNFKGDLDLSQFIGEDLPFDTKGIKVGFKTDEMVFDGDEIDFTNTGIVYYEKPDQLDPSLEVLIKKGQIDNFKIKDGMILREDFTAAGVAFNGPLAEQVKAQIGGFAMMLGGQSAEVQGLPEKFLKSLENLSMQASYEFDPADQTLDYTDQTVIPGFISIGSEIDADGISENVIKMYKTFAGGGIQNLDDKDALQAKVESLGTELESAALKKMQFKIKDEGLVKSGFSIASSMTGMSDKQVRDQALQALQQAKAQAGKQDNPVVQQIIDGAIGAFGALISGEDDTLVFSVNMKNGATGADFKKLAEAEGDLSEDEMAEKVFELLNIGVTSN